MKDFGFGKEMLLKRMCGVMYYDTELFIVYWVLARNID